jgi:hypothetical protein
MAICYTVSNLKVWPTKKQNLNQVQLSDNKKLSDNKNINLKMPSFLWQGDLLNRASKIEHLLAHHDIHLPRARVKLHLWF